jgi:hypothetical protein
MILDNLAQEFEPFAGKIGGLDRQPGDVAAGSRQARDEAAADRVARRREHDRDNASLPRRHVRAAVDTGRRFPRRALYWQRVALRETAAESFQQDVTRTACRLGIDVVAHSWKLSPSKCVNSIRPTLLGTKRAWVAPITRNRNIGSNMTVDKAPLKRLIRALNHNPIIRRAKNWRNGLLDRHFRSRGHAEGKSRFETLLSHDTNGLCFTIAFNAPWVIEILIAAWRRYPPGLELIVVDNSSDHRNRAQIKLICQTHGVSYIGLPKNLEWNPNRSHGIAMNWVFYNVVKELRPEIFGFIDHDCFPCIPFNIEKRMEGKSVYGLKALSGMLPGAWNMWAGFCFFRFSQVENLELDFKHRLELGLDTGGGNWPVLYREIDTDSVAVAPIGACLHGLDGLHSLIDGAFIHVGGASYRKHFDKATQRKDISDRIWDSCLGGIENRILNEF